MIRVLIITSKDWQACTKELEVVYEVFIQKMPQIILSVVLSNNRFGTFMKYHMRSTTKKALHDICIWSRMWALEISHYVHQ